MKVSKTEFGRFISFIRHRWITDGVPREKIMVEASAKFDVCSELVDRVISSMCYQCHK